MADPDTGSRADVVRDQARRALDRVRPAWDHPVGGPVLKVFVAYIVIIEVAVQVVFGRIDLPFVDVALLEVGRLEKAVPRETFANGALIGLLYALLGMGLILVYRANRIINFAQAQLGSVPAVVALLLINRKDVNYWLTIPILIVGAILLGALVEVLFMRRFRDAPRLIATVATIGISLLLLALEFAVQTWITGELVTSSEYRTPFKGWVAVLGNMRFSGDFFVAAAVTAVIVLGLAAFFRYTDMGIAVRASAENAERASLLGIPVRRVSTVVWVIAAVMSAVAIFLRAPMVGLTLGSSIGPSVLLYGLAAAVIARMESLPLCLVAGMGIGAIDQAALFSTGRASLAIASMLVVILIALLAQRKALTRAQDAATGTWQTVKEFRPIPSELRGVREVVMAQWLLGAVIAGVVFVLPAFLDEKFAGRFTLLAIFAMVGVSLVILTGWAGQISLGQFAISGIGAAVAGGLAANHGIDFFATIIAAGLAGAAVAILIGLPALRIQGLFLAVTTLAFAFTVENFVLSREWFGWLLPKADFDVFVQRPVLYGRFDASSDLRFYYLTLVFLGLSLLIARSVRKNRSGRLFMGTRDNGRAVQAYGVNLARTRLAAFAISGFIAAVAGALLAYQSFGVDAGTYSPERSIALFAMTVIGGLTSLPGAMLGALYVEGIPFIFNNSNFVRLLTSGVGLLFLLLVLPGGLSEGFYRLRDSFLRRVAAKHSIHVPSLVADSLVVDDDQADHAVAGARDTAEATELLPAEAISCPACGELVAIADAHGHEHFRVDGDGALTRVGADALDQAGGNGHRRRDDENPPPRRPLKTGEQ